jgi:hypothetical protein
MTAPVARRLRCSLRYHKPDTQGVFMKPPDIQNTLRDGTNNMTYHVMAYVTIMTIYGASPGL